MNPASGANRALITACASGQQEVVRLLLAIPEVNPTELENAGLLAACRGGHASVVKLLLSDERVVVCNTKNIDRYYSKFSDEVKEELFLHSELRANK